MTRLLALFVLVPLVELALLIQLGKVVGLLPTLGLIVLTGFLGAWLTRSQGVGVLRRAQAELDQGRVPAGALVDGTLILLAGGVLLTPGLLTDVVGFALLVPAVRSHVRARVVEGFRRAVREGRVQLTFTSFGTRFPGTSDATGSGPREPEWEDRERESGQIGGAPPRSDDPRGPSD